MSIKHFLVKIRMGKRLFGIQLISCVIRANLVQFRLVKITGTTNCSVARDSYCTNDCPYKSHVAVVIATV